MAATVTSSCVASCIKNASTALISAIQGSNSTTPPCSDVSSLASCLSACPSTDKEAQAALTTLQTSDASCFDSGSGLPGNLKPVVFYSIVGASALVGLVLIGLLIWLIIYCVKKHKFGGSHVGQLHQQYDKLRQEYNQAIRPRDRLIIQQQMEDIEKQIRRAELGNKY